MSDKYEQAIQELVGAMKASVQMGSTDHLDCAEDGGAFWYNAIARSEALLGKTISATTDFTEQHLE